MKIEQSSLQSESMALAWKHSQRSTSIELSIGQNLRPPPEPVSRADISANGLATQQSEALEDGTEGGMDSRLKLLIAVIEALTGRKIEIFDPASLQGEAAAPSQDMPASAPAESTRSAPAELAWSVRIEHKEVREEFGVAAYHAKGQVTTSDGRQIKFSLDMLMQRYERVESSSIIEAGNTPKATDPLVLNLGTDHVRLRAEEFSFDLNADGQVEQLAMLDTGSAWLALDQNGNGKIDNGQELFGPQTGNGFAELAALDDDGNGWIDENDAAFSALKLWRPDEDPKSLAESGVGAIALQHRSTPFQLKQDGELLGAIRSSGVFLTEEGQARSIQQVDMVI